MKNIEVLWLNKMILGNLGFCGVFYRVKKFLLRSGLGRNTFCLILLWFILRFNKIF